ncbi:MAG TPA: hypothetical protein VIL74_07520 [Pyrinomonadaceae bacterium]|jgi:hypothetical protein
MRDIDIIKDIEARELQVTKLQEEISALRKVAEIYGLGERSTVLINPAAKKPFGGTKFPIAVGDACAKLLANEKKGLHLDTILAKIAEQGVTPTRSSLDSALRNDGKRRFLLLGNRVWKLKGN